MTNNTINHDETAEEGGIMTTTADTLLVPPTTTTTTAPASGVDYVGTKQSVLELFSLPFSDQSVSVGIHNVEGCLLIEADPALGAHNYYNYNANKARGTDAKPENRKENIKQQTLPKQPQVTAEEDDEAMVVATQQSAALSAISSLIEQGQQHADNNNQTVPHPALDKAVELFETKSSSAEPREYLPWEFSGMKLLVGSDAIVYRSTPETSLTVRVEDAAARRKELEAYQTNIMKDRNNNNLNNINNNQDGKNAAEQHAGKRTYAEALRSRQLLANQQQEAKENDKNSETNPSENNQEKDVNVSGASIDFDRDTSTYSFQLQTTIVPSTNLPLASKFSISSEPPQNSSDPSSPAASSPIVTVLDAYLDNLIANVPQLALVLREKGFVQSVKLLHNDHLSALMQPETYDTSNPFEVINKNKKDKDVMASSTAEHVFDPKVLKMNASSLLSFLKNNCTKDNATYLLHREAGQSNIQLLDISSQRQKQWIWYLSMMSYRFSQRLKHLSEQMAEDSVLCRSFRNRERSLLQNTLSLLTDIEDQRHEILIAEVCEKLADTFLRARASTADENEPPTSSATTNSNNPAEAAQKPAPAISKTLQQKYSSVRPDSLSKANDYLAQGAGILFKLWTQTTTQIQQQQQGINRSTSTDDSEVVSVEADSSSSDEEVDEEHLEAAVKAEALAFQLIALQDKIIDIALRLAEHHLGTYWSSSVLQSLRSAARRMADATEVCQFAKQGKENRKHLPHWKHRLQLQYTRLMELCGHFARSFAADELWRERGHAAGDDVITILRDVEIALPLQRNQPTAKLPFIAKPRAEHIFAPFEKQLLEECGDLWDLTGVCDAGEEAQDAVEAAKQLLESKRQIGRDKRRVLVAASISYHRAVVAYEASINFHNQDDIKKGTVQHASTSEAGKHLEPEEAALLNLLRQRLGDAQNELGKLFLKELQLLLSATNAARQSSKEEPGADAVDDKAAEPLLASAEHCFNAGLKAFEMCGDKRNAALLRCNLCQCYKLRANANFSGDSSSEGKSKTSNASKTSHADANLKKAIQHLEAAHEILDIRETDPVCWDMVSNELAATLLVQGVRRRQALLGGGNGASLLHLLRLSPGETRSIIEPMDKALGIYEQSGNLHQAAAVHYQLAQFFSKIWTCQRDEAQTREKLSLALSHYKKAHAFFASSLRGNETTFVLLCLDLSNLYSTVAGEAGEECLCQAFLCCLDTLDAFSPDSIQSGGRTVEGQEEWLKTMATLAASVEDRVFKTLRSLVKLEEKTGGKSYKDIYRAALGAKMRQAKPTEEENPSESALSSLHCLLQAAKEAYSASTTKPES